MRVSYSWLKDLIDVPESPEELAAEFIRTGTEVESIDTVGESFDNVVTAKVVSKTPHPDSDHMWITMVDVGRFNLGEDGEPEPLQIVCGAQNFNEGDHIVTALVGAELPGGIKIKKSKLRGQVSWGMNCSARELGLSGDHSGIMILPEDAPVGMPFAEYRGTADTVLDCEITAQPPRLPLHDRHRPRGRRDLRPRLPYRASPDRLRGRPPDRRRGLGRDRRRGPVRPLRRPHRPQREGRPLARVDGRAPRLLRRPLDQQHRRHHQLRDDAHRAAAPRLRPRHLRRARRPPSRGGARRPRRGGVPDARWRRARARCRHGAHHRRWTPVALAGVMGGMDSEIEDDTRDVLIESACFDAGRTSHTSRDLSLISEASIRFERQVDEAGCVRRSPTSPRPSSSSSRAARSRPATSTCTPPQRRFPPST